MLLIHLTQRPIKKNGKSYYNLLESGILPSDEKDEKPIDKNIICVIKDMEKKDVEILRKEYNNNNEKYFASVGRGKHSGYLIRKAKKQLQKMNLCLKLGQEGTESLSCKNWKIDESDDEMDEEGISQLIARFDTDSGRSQVIKAKSKYIIID